MMVFEFYRQGSRWAPSHDIHISNDGIIKEVTNPSTQEGIRRVVVRSRTNAMHRRIWWAVWRLVQEHQIVTLVFYGF